MTFKTMLRHDQVKGFGLLADLDTVAKGTLVDAINELAGKSGAENFLKEVPTGAIDGTNVTFVSSEAPLQNSFAVLYNGLEMDGGGQDYTVAFDVDTGIATVTLLVAPEPEDVDNGVPADKIHFKYFIDTSVV